MRRSVVNSPSWTYLQGDEFLSIYRPFSLPDAGTEQMAAALQKYQHFSKTQFPTLFQYESWAGADLMIRGLQMAGANPTRAAVIKGPTQYQELHGQWIATQADRLRRPTLDTIRQNSASGSSERKRKGSFRRPLSPSVGRISRERRPRVRHRSTTSSPRWRRLTPFPQSELSV